MKAWVPPPERHKPALVAHISNFCTQKGEAGDSPKFKAILLYRQFRASLGYVFNLKTTATKTLRQILAAYTSRQKNKRKWKQRTTRTAESVLKVIDSKWGRAITRQHRGQQLPCSGAQSTVQLFPPLPFSWVSQGTQQVCAPGCYALGRGRTGLEYSRPGSTVKLALQTPRSHPHPTSAVLPWLFHRDNQVIGQWLSSQAVSISSITESQQGKGSGLPWSGL